jgi:hypothetical protein
MSTFYDIIYVVFLRRASSLTHIRSTKTTDSDMEALLMFSEQRGSMISKCLQ